MKLPASDIACFRRLFRAVALVFTTKGRRLPAIGAIAPWLPRLSTTLYVALAVSAGLGTPAAAATIDNQFRAWLANDLWPEARARGISSQTFEAAFDGVR